MKWNALTDRKDGAGDGTRTRDVQLGKTLHDRFLSITEVHAVSPVSHNTARIESQWSQGLCRPRETHGAATPEEPRKNTGEAVIPLRVRATFLTLLPK